MCDKRKRRARTQPGRWVDAGDLVVGDLLFLKPDRRAAIEEIKVEPTAGSVYNFQVGSLHTYAVGFAATLVHNNAPCYFGTPGFGNQVHQKFLDALVKQTETEPGDWFMRTAIGQNGVDAEFIGPASRNPGFNYAELKPATESGWNTFTARWITGIAARIKLSSGATDRRGQSGQPVQIFDLGAQYGENGVGLGTITAA